MAFIYLNNVIEFMCLFEMCNLAYRLKKKFLGLGFKTELLTKGRRIYDSKYTKTIITVHFNCAKILWGETRGDLVIIIGNKKN